MKQRPFCDMRPSMLKNALLQRPKIGRTIRSTHDLPDDDYRYGIIHHDSYGVAECLKWDTSFDVIRRNTRSPRRGGARSPSPEDLSVTPREQIRAAPTGIKVKTKTGPYGDPRAVRKGRPNSAIASPTRFRQPVGGTDCGPKRDFIATNKAALKAGCVTSREYREFQKNHRINVKPEENLALAEDEFARMLHRAMVHGIPTPVTSEMKECLTGQGYRDAKAKALRRREIRAARKEAKASLKSDRKRYTRAARGQTCKPDTPPSYADTYKIPRFRDIEGYAIDDKWPKV